MKRQPWLARNAGLFVALGLPFIFDMLLGKRPEDMAIPSKVFLAIVEEWFLVAVLLIIVVFWERRPIDSIGIRKMTGRDILWGVIGFLIGALSFILTMPLVQGLGLETTSAGIGQLARVPIFLRIAVVFTAGITEEILFRGYPIERLTSMTGSPVLGAAISYVVFVVLHLPFWGPGGAIQIGVWSLIVTWLYVRRRNLPACMLMHILNDAYAFLLLPIFIPQYLR